MDTIELTRDQLEIIGTFLSQVRERAKPSREELAQCFQPHSWGNKVWKAYGVSLLDVQTALWWYRFRHKPGSKEERPPYILRALIKATERDYFEPERIPVNDAALRAGPADVRRARSAFIKKHGVAAFYQHVNPILTARRRGGVKALFEAPATPEIREYVAILTKIAGKQKPIQ